MIVASLVLITGAIALLVLGLLEGSSGLLVGSIGTSLLAAVALIVGVRQAASDPVDVLFDEDLDQSDRDELMTDRRTDRTDRPDRYDDDDYSDGSASWESLAEQQAHGGRSAGESAAGGSHVPAQVNHSRDTGAADVYDEEDPPDEPVPQRVSAAESARVARMMTEVLVIDGRPRYHVAGCVHLLGRPYEGLAVSEAVELGFTPCGLCEPDSALLADARRV